MQENKENCTLRKTKRGIQGASFTLTPGRQKGSISRLSTPPIVSYATIANSRCSCRHRRIDELNDGRGSKNRRRNCARWDGVVFCGVFFCMQARGVPTSCSNSSPFLTARDRCELVGHGFDPIKLHKPTMHNMMRTDAIDAREPTVFMVEEAQKSRLLDAARLLPSILTSSSYVDCVEFVF